MRETQPFGTRKRRCVGIRKKQPCILYPRYEKRTFSSFRTLLSAVRGWGGDGRGKGVKKSLAHERESECLLVLGLVASTQWIHQTAERLIREINSCESESLREGEREVHDSADCVHKRRNLYSHFCGYFDCAVFTKVFPSMAARLMCQSPCFVHRTPHRGNEQQSAKHHIVKQLCVCA